MPTPATRIPIIHDGDFGIDDALALLYLTAHPATEVIAVGSVHGNTPAGQAARNAIAVLDVAGRLDIPVATGAARPMAQPLEISAMVHGHDGLGGSAPEPSRGPAAGLSAAEQMVRAVRATPGEITILATGPLTNLALAVLLDPDFPSLVGHVVVMGGTLDAPGNITPFAEANIWHDPEAADLVLGAGFPLTLVGLDVTMRAWAGPRQLDCLAAGRTAGAAFLWPVLQHYLAFYRARHAVPGMPLHDPTAAAVALDPTLIETIAVPVAVELRSPATRGMLLVDRRELAAEHGAGGATVKVAVRGDATRIVDEVFRAF